MLLRPFRVKGELVVKGCTTNTVQFCLKGYLVLYRRIGFDIKHVLRILFFGIFTTVDRL